MSVRAPRALCLRIDPACRSEERPHNWGHGPNGRRWYVLDRSGTVIGASRYPGNAIAAWWEALHTLRARQTSEA